MERKSEEVGNRVPITTHDADREAVKRIVWPRNARDASSERVLLSEHSYVHKMSADVSASKRVTNRVP